MVEKPFHLVVRFSDTMFGVGDVVALHNDIVAAHGSVWFGKLGQTLSQGRVDLLNRQIAQKTPTFLYLVKGNRRRSSAYRADLLEVRRAGPRADAPVPPYYAEKDLLQFMKAWMRIGPIESIEMSEMERLKALNSVFPIAETLVRSSSGYFLVRESNSRF